MVVVVVVRRAGRGSVCGSAWSGLAGVYMYMSACFLLCVCVCYSHREGLPGLLFWRKERNKRFIMVTPPSLLSSRCLPVCAFLSPSHTRCLPRMFCAPPLPSIAACLPVRVCPCLSLPHHFFSFFEQPCSCMAGLRACGTRAAIELVVVAGPLPLMAAVRSGVVEACVSCLPCLLLRCWMQKYRDACMRA